MKDAFILYVLKLTQAQEVSRFEKIQELWSGYGQIIRCFLVDGNVGSVVVKLIDVEAANSHPRGWNTNASHQRKIQSYINETHWYTEFNNLLPNSSKTPELLGVCEYEGQKLLVLEDLDFTGFLVRKSSLPKKEVKAVLTWLASFHAFHLGKEAGELWNVGSYWHLATRKEEWNAIENQEIKCAAKAIDTHLNSARFQTLIHGDAKVANFCFPKRSGPVAAVDFQYTGKGVGVKDVAYLLGSCLTEAELFDWNDDLLDFYFEQLKSFLRQTHPGIDESEIESEWRQLYAFAWADFTRFLLGWMPTHHKLNGFAHQQMQIVLNELKQHENE